MEMLGSKVAPTAALFMLKIPEATNRVIIANMHARLTSTLSTQCYRNGYRGVETMQFESEGLHVCDSVRAINTEPSHVSIPPDHMQSMSTMHANDTVIARWGHGHHDGGMLTCEGSVFIVL